MNWRETETGVGYLRLGLLSQNLDVSLENEEAGSHVRKVVETDFVGLGT